MQVRLKSQTLQIDPQPCTHFQHPYQQMPFLKKTIMTPKAPNIKQQLYEGIMTCRQFCTNNQNKKKDFKKYWEAIKHNSNNNLSTCQIIGEKDNYKNQLLLHYQHDQKFQRQKQNQKTIMLSIQDFNQIQSIQSINIELLKEKDQKIKNLENQMIQITTNSIYLKDNKIIQQKQHNIPDPPKNYKPKRLIKNYYKPQQNVNISNTLQSLSLTEMLNIKDSLNEQKYFKLKSQMI